MLFFEWKKKKKRANLHTEVHLTLLLQRARRGVMEGLLYLSCASGSVTDGDIFVWALNPI